MNALKNTVHLPIFAWEQIFSSLDRDCYSGSGIRIVNSDGIRKSVTLGLRSFAPGYIDFYIYILYISIILYLALPLGPGYIMHVLLKTKL